VTIGESNEDSPFGETANQTIPFLEEPTAKSQEQV